EPTADVTLSQTAGTGISGSPNFSPEGAVPVPVVFTPTTGTSSDWNIPHVVTIVGQNEFIDDGDQPYTITMTAASSDGGYNTLVSPAVSATNLDNDGPTPTTVIEAAVGGQDGVSTNTVDQARITFSANMAATFHCKLDSGSYSVCTSPMTVSATWSSSHT